MLEHVYECWRAWYSAYSPLENGSGHGAGGLNDGFTLEGISYLEEAVAELGLGSIGSLEELAELAAGLSSYGECTEGEADLSLQTELVPGDVAGQHGHPGRLAVAYDSAVQGVAVVHAQAGVCVYAVISEKCHDLKRNGELGLAVTC